MVFIKLDVIRIQYCYVIGILLSSICRKRPMLTITKKQFTLNQTARDYDIHIKNEYNDLAKLLLVFE